MEYNARNILSTTFVCTIYFLSLRSICSFAPQVQLQRCSSHVISFSYKPEVIQHEEDGSEEDLEWLPDREKARIIKQNKLPKSGDADPYGFDSSEEPLPTSKKSKQNEEPDVTTNTRKKKRLTYTEEEEELIEILGGKDKNKPSSLRESGFLGDCTLREIAMDFQVPICYLADVLCGWGVPPPIDTNAILGDMVTGEQAFAILEAIHTLDVGSLNDRYADFDLATLCNEYEIDLASAFELAMKEGWNLPFGVRTFLRVEQEEHLLEKLATDYYS